MNMWPIKDVDYEYRTRYLNTSKSLIGDAAVNTDVKTITSNKSSGTKKVEVHVPVFDVRFSKELSIPEPIRVISNPPHTIVFFNDGTKQVVKCSENDEYSLYGGFVNAIAIKLYKTNSHLKKSVDRMTVKQKPKRNKKDHKDGK